jgi:hypothetical protein
MYFKCHRKIIKFKLTWSQQPFSQLPVTKPKMLFLHLTYQPMLCNNFSQMQVTKSKMQFQISQTFTKEVGDLMEPPFMFQ